MKKQYADNYEKTFPNTLDQHNWQIFVRNIFSAASEPSNTDLQNNWHKQNPDTILFKRQKSHVPLSVFRYPGGKSRYIKQIMPHLSPEATTFHDVFVGGGSVMLAYASANIKSQISVNDLDENMYSFWKMITEPDSTIENFKKLISKKPTVDLFVEVKNSMPDTLIGKAYKALFLNRCAFSGIVTSGPLGGYNQESEYKIDSRFNADVIIYRILRMRELLCGRLSVHNLHAVEYLDTIKQGDVTYLDPPYYAKGKLLYPVYMLPIEHQALSNRLKEMYDWVLSYDAHDEIVHMYQEFSITTHLKTKYSISKSSGNTLIEYIITPIMKTAVMNTHISKAA